MTMLDRTRLPPPPTTSPADRSSGPPHDAAGLVLGAATVAMGLIAGVFYAYACSVMLALEETDDRTFVDVMRRINVRIENPVFFASFFGALALTAVAAVLERRRGRGAALRWVAAALVLYVVALVVTVAVNVPLNQRLADAGDLDAIVDLHAVRERFEDRWVAWNIVRAAASAGATACLARALVLHGRDA